MKVHELPETLPFKYRQWFVERSEKELTTILKVAVDKRILSLAPEYQEHLISREHIDREDELYFLAEEGADIESAVIHFQKARVLSAHVSLNEGDVSRASYEYFHSFPSGEVTKILGQLNGV